MTFTRATKNQAGTLSMVFVRFNKELADDVHIKEIYGEIHISRFEGGNWTFSYELADKFSSYISCKRYVENGFKTLKEAKDKVKELDRLSRQLPAIGSGLF